MVKVPSVLASSTLYESIATIQLPAVESAPTNGEVSLADVKETVVEVSPALSQL